MPSPSSFASYHFRSSWPPFEHHTANCTLSTPLLSSSTFALIVNLLSVGVGPASNSVTVGSVVSKSVGNAFCTIVRFPALSYMYTCTWYSSLWSLWFAMSTSTLYVPLPSFFASYQRRSSWPFVLLQTANCTLPMPLTLSVAPVSLAVNFLAFTISPPFTFKFSSLASGGSLSTTTPAPVFTVMSCVLS